MSSDDMTAAVTIESGSLQGVEMANGVRAFKGIPYASPPVGELRWREPQRHPAWRGTRDATAFGPRAMQSGRLGDIDPQNPRMDEDCLYLNVWAPPAGSGPRPVMVWIHGGGFTIGAGSEPWYSGENFAQRGIVFISINYRLDAFGFLAHPQLESVPGSGISGNFGLLDQIAALEWVQRNSAAFGGDPGNVTVIGESAGSVSVSILMASARARGLFQKAIAQSGASFLRPTSPFTLIRPEPAAVDGLDFARALGADNPAALRELPAERVLAESLKSPRFFGRFGPVLDAGRVLSVDAPVAFESGQQNDVPLLAGWTTDEGTLFNARRSAQAFGPTFEGEMWSRFGEGARRLFDHYPVASRAESDASSDALMGDDLVGYPMWRWMELQKKTGRSPVYRYLFDFRPPAPEMSVTPLAAPGVFHSADIPYALDTFAAMPWAWRDADHRLKQIMSSYWIQFAATGDPNGGDLPTWPEYVGGGGGKIMRFGAEVKASSELRRPQFELLDQLFQPR